MKKRPILDPTQMVSLEVKNFIEWYRIMGLYETAQIFVYGYRYDVHQHMEFEKMRHTGAWSKVSI